MEYDGAMKTNESASRVPERGEIPAEMTWDLSRMYADGAVWEADFARLGEILPPLDEWKGKLSGAAEIRQLFELEEGVARLLNKLYVYAHLKHDEDTAAAEGQAREERIRSAYAEAAGRMAWIVPELAAKSAEELRRLAGEAALAPWARRLEKLAREKAHVLPEAAETVLAQFGDVLGAPEQVFSMLTEADMAFPDAVAADGTGHALTEGTYGKLLQSPDGALRRSAFETLYKGYKAWRNTLAATLGATVKEHVVDARVRGYPSARAAALFDDQVPEAVYDNLIASTREALPMFHRYVALRRRALGGGALGMADMYVPLVGGEAPEATPEQSREWVLAACRPLGGEYMEILARAFGERWIDWLENKGKATGAYSSGCYDSPPYLLLNHNGRLDDAFTLAHEAGHSVHTWLANRAQPPSTAEYPIFLAEIASTVNELLLSHHLLAETRDAAMRTYLLNHLCDSFKGTVFRQVMFAEFERDIHAAVERGEPLVADGLCRDYAALNAAYYGPELEADSGPESPIAMEWARIPHFYYDFYVYKYATSFCAALVFARRIREGRGVADYLGMLRGGGSRDPLDAIRDAGVDLSRPEVVRDAFREFGRTLEALETALDGGGAGA